MADTASVLAQLPALPGVTYPVLVPNERGLTALLDFLNSTPSPPAVEVAVFAAASDAFSRANTNCTIAESLERLAPTAARAAKVGLPVRGYVSVVIACPYTGPVEYKRVRDVAKALVEMGCSEVSLGDTTGAGTPASVGVMLDVVKDAVPVEQLAVCADHPSDFESCLTLSQTQGHFHDTFGTALSNIFASLSAGVRTFDASVAGLGGCPYSPGATGNVATEDVVYALRGAGWDVPGDVSEIARTGEWVSTLLGRRSESRAGRAVLARERAKEEKEKRRAMKEEKEAANIAP